MIHNKELPKAVLELLLSKGIDRNDIIAFSPADMTLDAEFAEGYAALTKNRIAIITSPPDISDVYYFKGATAGKKARAAAPSPKQFALKLIDNDSVSRLEIAKGVCGGILFSSAALSDGDCATAQQPGGAESTPGAGSQPVTAGQSGGAESTPGAGNQPATAGQSGGAESTLGTGNQPATAGQPGAESTPGAGNQPATAGQPGAETTLGTGNQPVTAGQSGGAESTLGAGNQPVTAGQPGAGERPEKGAEEKNEARLCAFTNQHMGSMARLVRLFDKIKRKKELTEEDLRIMEQNEYCPKCGGMYPDRARKICPKCLDKRSIFLRTLVYFKPFIPQIIIMVLCYIASSVLNLAWPYLNGKVLYDMILTKDDRILAFLNLGAGRFVVALLLVVLTMVLTRITLQLLGIIQGALTAKIVPDVVKNLKTAVFTSMGKLSVNFFNNRQTGSLMTRVLSDAERVTGFFIDGLPYLFINALTMLLTLTVMFGINAFLAGATVALMPIFFIVSFKLLPVLWFFYGKRHRAERGLNARINDNLTGARVVKAFGKEKSEIERFDTYNRKVQSAELSLVGFDNRFSALYSSVESAISLIVWGVGSYIVISSADMKLGLLITFAGYVSQLKGPLNFLSHVFRWGVDSLNSAQRMYEIIDAVPEITETREPVRIRRMNGNILLRDVTFGYEPNKPVIKKLNLEIPNGSMLGIVGRSGAGKSTLVNLISRLYDPTEGRIYIDGVDIKEIAFPDLRRNVATVSQETYIFIGTAADNIAYANPEAGRHDIVHAAMLAGAHDFICKMPDGYDTVIGSSGRELSGGERQRISIARAILADPKILILDEATASVDTETERTIQKSLNYLIKNRTTISIAHRLSTLRDADRLVVIDNGEICEEGTHEELIGKKGVYYKLKELQTKALAMRGFIE